MHAIEREFVSLVSPTAPRNGAGFHPSKRPKVSPAIDIVAKALRPVIASLNDVLRKSGNVEAG